MALANHFGLSRIRWSIDCHRMPIRMGLSHPKRFAVRRKMNAYYQGTIVLRVSWNVKVLVILDHLYAASVGSLS